MQEHVRKWDRCGGAEQVAELRPDLERRARRAVDDPTVAEDLAQETIIRALTAVQRAGRPPADLRAFAFGILRHVIADWWRAQGRHQPIAGDWAAEAPTPLDELIRSEAARAVRSAIARLRPDDARIIQASYYEGLSSRELARRLREPGPRVRQRKSRALARLRHELAG
jgi:RNA polymerase sigma-70 factor (ECF subfamily)